MSDLIKKCRKDGTEFGGDFTGACPVCNGPLAFYCRKHNEWLAGAACPKCTKPAQPSRGISSDTVFVVGAGLFVLALIALVVFAFRRLVREPAQPSAVPVTTAVAPPKPTAAQPKPPPAATVKADTGPAFPTYPPASVTLADLLRDPARFEGKLVQTTGTAQFVEADKFTFDLRDGNRTIQVFFRYVTPESKAALGNGARFLVTGLLKRLEQEDGWQIVAQSIEAR
jgi:hypothetical protein